MNGKEKFISQNKELDFGMLEFWCSKFSNVYNIQEYIAEFLVEQALGIEKSHNTEYWTLFDILYKDYRIEIKETGYYHPWNENGKISEMRRFGITKANSKYENKESSNIYERQNDIYVFCLNVGKTKETSNPLNIDNWEFYIVPTKKINEVCKNYKSIGLNKVKKIATKVNYFEIKEYIDNLIDKMKYEDLL